MLSICCNSHVIALIQNSYCLRDICMTLRKEVRCCCDKDHDERLVSKSEYPFLFAISSRCTKLSWAIIFVLNLWDM